MKNVAGTFQVPSVKMRDPHTGRGIRSVWATTIKTATAYGVCLLLKLPRHTECVGYDENRPRHTEYACYYDNNRCGIRSMRATIKTATAHGVCLLLCRSVDVFELFDPKADVRIQAGSSLPHWYQAGVSYFVTFRTEDSIPAEVARQWRAQRATWLLQHGISASDPQWRERLGRLPETLRWQFHDTFSRQYLEALDKGLGACALRREELRKIVGDSLQHFDGDRYHLGDFVVMPNHVHVIVCLLRDTEIEAQCTSWKRYTARQINQMLGTSGRFWQEESFDHLIRSPEQFESVERYIRNNPLHLPPDQYLLYQRVVAGTFQVPSANRTIPSR